MRDITQRRNTEINDLLNADLQGEEKAKKKGKKTVKRQTSSVKKTASPATPAPGRRRASTVTPSPTKMARQMRDLSKTSVAQRSGEDSPAETSPD